MTKSMWAFALLAAGSLLGADVDGTWSGALDTPNGPLNVVSNLKAEGATLTGTVVGPDGAPIPISGGKIDGNNLTFLLSVNMGQPLTIQFNGVQSGDQISWKLDMGGGAPPMAYVAKRTGASPSAVASAGTNVDGNWKGSIETPMGAIDIAYSFKADGAALTGGMIGPDGMAIPIANGKIDGSKISFSVTLDFGMPFTMEYTGVIEGDHINLKSDVGGQAIEYVVKRR